MDKILRWAILFIVLVILASGAVAFYAVFFGEKPLSVPPFREMSVIDAVAEAERLGLSVRIEQMESTLPPGRVLAQYPEAGTKIRGDKTLILKISRGGEARPIPDVRGIELTRATRMLQEQGFSVGEVTKIKAGTGGVGEVIAQSPAAPANVPVNKKINLLVSSGTEDGRFAVPDVAQMEEDDARQMLTSVGLKITQTEKVRNRNILAGLVVNTRPAAGTLVKQGTNVRVFVSAGDVDDTITTPVTPGRNPTQPQQGATTLPGTETNASDLSVLDQQAEIRRQQEINRTAPRPEPTVNTQTPVPAPNVQPIQPNPANPPVQGEAKVARIRYQVPPISTPMAIKVEISDPNGTRVLLNRNSRSNESVRIDGSYAREAVVTITLGGELVWQEQFK